MDDSQCLVRRDARQGSMSTVDRGKGALAIAEADMDIGTDVSPELSTQA